MSSRELYSGIDLLNKNYLMNGNIITDENLANLNTDTRLGLSLIIPVNHLETGYDRLINAFTGAEPGQYYYPYSDLHITIFDLIKGNVSYIRDERLEKCYIEICGSLFNNIRKFEIDFTGIIFSKEAGLIKGYDSNILASMRESIREALRNRNLPPDERYRSESAHITFCRFKDKIQHLNLFNQLIEEFKEFHFGRLLIDRIELVEHDWYNLKSKKRIIKNILLK